MLNRVQMSCIASGWHRRRLWYAQENCLKSCPLLLTCPVSDVLHRLSRACPSTWPVRPYRTSQACDYSINLPFTVPHQEGWHAYPREPGEYKRALAWWYLSLPYHSVTRGSCPPDMWEPEENQANGAGCDRGRPVSRTVSASKC